VSGHAIPFPRPEKCASGGSVGSVFVHSGVSREILFHVAVAKSNMSEIVAALGVSPVEVGRVVELYLAAIADVRSCSECERWFASLSYDDLKCPVCAAFSGIDNAS